MTPMQIRVAFYALIGGLLLALFFLWLNSRDNTQELQASAEQGVRTDRAASGISQDASAAGSAQRAQDSAVAEVRVIHQHQYEEARRNDPTVRDFDGTPVPQRLRDIARSRREARERLGCDGDGCGSPRPAEGASR